MHHAKLTLSHNPISSISGSLVAAGPIGRTAEAGASASTKNIAAIYSYSKSKGLFAGVSIEGSVIVERKDANETFYRQKVTASELLSGSLVPPPQADILYRALNARTSGPSSLQRGSSEYDVESRSNQSALVGRSATTAGRFGGGSGGPSHGGYGAPQQPIAFGRASYEDRTTYHRESETDHQLPRYTPSAVSTGRNPAATSRPAPPPPPTKVPPPIAAKPEVVTALYDFAGEQATDLPFKKGDIITVVKKTDSRNDWWTGKVNGREGSFPANYTQ